MNDVNFKWAKGHGPREKAMGKGIDAPPNSLRDSIMSPKVTIMEGEGVGVCSLVRNTSWVERHARALGWD